jgi:N-acylneuraminate cytidylyltransferase/CMP-N,N'-diacetyllegionaminic acid synthase
MRVLCTICARAGSKGVPSKNIRSIAGKPLIVHTIEQARACPLIHKIVVSTDGDDIARIAREAGVEVPFLRPSELAMDQSPKLAVIQHAVRFLLERGEKYDLIVDLDPTSPLRLPSDIENALQLFLKSDAHNLYSVCPARKNPYFNMVELDECGRSGLSKVLGQEIAGRQSAPLVYEINGSIYIFRAEFLLGPVARLHSDNTIVYVMPEERSVDIDTPLDFRLVELLLKERGESGLSKDLLEGELAKTAS